MNIVRLWTGALASAVVAALVAIVGYMVVDRLLEIPVVTPAWNWVGNTPMTTIAVHAAAAALIAAALLQLLTWTTPQPQTFFNWIATLATAVAALWPFAVDATTESRVGSGVIYLVVGLTIVSLTNGVASSARTS
ncbi:DUF6069 family protein [Rhodococcus sp. NPDC058521]|uniref:DUF6069 family protein n=1 Tax=Rhodococcus sp. NPDC058521 TaxID=3346536 RepID=UPI0036531B45